MSLMQAWHHRIVQLFEEQALDDLEALFGRKTVDSKLRAYLRETLLIAHLATWVICC